MATGYSDDQPGFTRIVDDNLFTRQYLQSLLGEEGIV